MILVGDVGATHTRLALYQDNHLVELFEKPSAQVTDFSEEVSAYLDRVRESGYAPVQAAIACTGAHSTKRIQHPAIPFSVDRADIMQDTSLSDVRIANDLYVIANAASDECIAIGIGTGLGTAVKRSEEVIAVEAGHLSFTAQNGLELRLSEFVSEKLGRAAEYEDVLSGRGIMNIYAFLCQHEFSASPELVHGDQVFSSDDPCALKTIELFSKFFMRFCTELRREFSVQKIVCVGSVIQNNPQLASQKDMVVSQDPNVTLKAAASLFDM